MGPANALILVIVTFVAVAIALTLIYLNLQKNASNWSLSDALSEEVETLEDDGAGKIAKKPELKASISRLIALFGLIAIMMLYVSAGLAVLYGFANNGLVSPATKDVGTFFLYGAILFAPYIVNKFSSIFSWLK